MDSTSSLLDIDYQKALELLGASSRTQLAPILLSCPACGVLSAHLHQVSYNPGWVTCSTCHFSAHIVKALQCKWKCEISDCAQQLQTHNLLCAVPDNLPDILQTIEAQHRQFQQHTELWKTGSTLSCTGDTFLRQRNDAWRHPEIRSITAAKFHQRMGKPALPGLQPADLLLISPHHTAPGCIDGFVISRAGDSACQWWYGTRAWPEALSQVTLDPTPPVARPMTQLITPDWKLAAWLHTRHTQDSSLPLPVRVMHGDAERLVLPSTDKSAVCFGTLEQLADVILLACQLQIRVSDFRATWAEYQKNTANHTATEWLRLLKTQTISWQNALYDYLRMLLPEDCSRYWNCLPLSPNTRDAFLSCCPERFRQQLQQSHPPREKYQNTGRTQLHDNTWVVDKLSHVIFPAHIHVTHKITGYARAVTYLRGEIYYQETHYPFCVPQTDWGDNCFDWCRRYLEMQGVVLPATAPWAGDTNRLILQHSQPVLVTGTQTLGWSPVTQRIQFPRFSISADGQIYENPAPTQDTATLPGHWFPRPETVDHINLQRLKHAALQHSECIDLYVTFLCTLLAPLFNHPAQPWELSAPLSQNWRQFLERVFDITHKNPSDWFHWRDDAMRIFPPGINVPIVKTHVLTLTDTPVPEILQSHGAHLWVNYLQMLARHHFFFRREMGNLIQTILQDFTAWLHIPTAPEEVHS